MRLPCFDVPGEWRAPHRRPRSTLVWELPCILDAIERTASTKEMTVLFFGRAVEYTRLSDRDSEGTFTTAFYVSWNSADWREVIV